MAREDWKRLADFVIHRRVSLGYRTRQSFAQAIGVTAHTLGVLENGKRVSPDTLAAVEQGLEWLPGSARAVLEGDEPSVAGAPPAAAKYSGPELRDETEREIWSLRRISDDEKWTFIFLHRALLEKERQATMGHTG